MEEQCPFEFSSGSIGETNSWVTMLGFYEEIIAFLCLGELQRINGGISKHRIGVKYTIIDRKRRKKCFPATTFHAAFLLSIHISVLSLCNSRA